MSTRPFSNSHPNFIAPPGSDVEEELSESASQAEARKHLESLEAEAFYQDQADLQWWQKYKRGQTPSLKSRQGSIRSVRKEDYRRYDSPPNLGAMLEVISSNGMEKGPTTQPLQLI